MTAQRASASDPGPVGPPGRGRTHRLSERLTPKLVSVLAEGYRLADLRADALAGLTVAVVALPLAMGIAVASGVPPATGLMTAIVAGGLCAILSGSRHQVGGPTAAFAVVVADVIGRHGVEGLAVATVMAGGMLLLAAVLRAGQWMRYVPEPVVLGFTVGIAATIASTQLAPLLGLAATAHEPLPRLWRTVTALPDASWPTGLVGIGVIVAIVWLRRVRPRWPVLLLAAGAAGLGVWITGAPVATIADVYGDIPRALAITTPSWPGLEGLRALVGPAFTIAFLAGIESLLSASIADGMTGRRHRPDAELLAQGLANIASGALGGLPATGAIARTATNIRAGARSPVAALTHALALLLIVLAAAPLLGRAPLTALAGILLVVAWGMAEPGRLARLLTRAPWPDRLVLVTTAALTVMADLTVAVEVGVVLAALLLMHRLADVLEIRAAHEDDGADAPRTPMPAGVEAFSIRGPLFYAAVHRLIALKHRLPSRPRGFVLDLSGVPYVDATGAGAVIDLVREMQAEGARVVLVGARAGVLKTLYDLGLPKESEIVLAKTLDGAAARLAEPAPP